MKWHARVLKDPLEDIDHWFLEDARGRFIDVTREQFAHPERLRYGLSKRAWWNGFPTANAEAVILYVATHHPDVVVLSPG